MVLAAAEAAAAGVPSTRSWPPPFRPGPGSRFMAPSTRSENLRKGGRIGGAAATLGALLSIKPVIEVRDGVVEQESRQRTRAKSLHYLADKASSAGPLERLAIMSAATQQTFRTFLDLMADVRPGMNG